MANRYDIIHIDFQATAKGANAAIESIRKQAEDANKEVTELKAKIAEAPKNGVDDKTLIGWNEQLKVAERRFRQFSTAYKELVKGMRALDEGVKMFNDGSLATMTAAFQKNVNNAAKLAQSKLDVGTKEWRQMGALMQETEQNYARMQRDTDNLIESLQNGGTVFRKTLEDEKKGLQELMQVLPYMGTEYRKAEEQLQILTKVTDEMITKERQLKGEIVTTDDARRVSYQLTEKGAEEARKRAQAADLEIEKGKQTIATLEKEREEREKTARATAERAAKYREDQQMHEDEIERLRKEIETEETLATTKKNGVEALKKKAETARQTADTEIENQKNANQVYEEAKTKVENLRRELEAMGGQVKSAPSTGSTAGGGKTGAEASGEAVKKEGEEVKKTTEAKKESVAVDEKKVEVIKEEVKAEEKAVEVEKTREQQIEELIKQNQGLQARLKELRNEREDLILTQKEGAEATKAEANAFKDLSKEQAEAMLKAKQQMSTFKKEGEKWQISNRAEAQQFLFDTLGELEPSNVGKTELSLEDNQEKIGQLLGKFQSRYGIQGDSEALGAIRSLISEGGLIKSGMMNKNFINVKQSTANIDKLNKDIKDLTAVINGETKAEEKNVEAKRTVAEIDEEIAGLERQSMELSKQTVRLRNGQVDATESLTKENNEFTESQKKKNDSLKEELEVIKKMTKDQAKNELVSMNTKSTIGWEGGKLNVSNLEQVQSWIYANAKKINPDTVEVDKNGKVIKGSRVSAMKDGFLQLHDTDGGNKLNKLFTAFKKEYGLEGDNKEARALFKEIISKEGGIFKKGGVVDFKTGELEIPYDKEAWNARTEKLKAIIAVTNGTAQATDKSTDSTKKNTDAAKDNTKVTKEQTDAIKEQEAEVRRRKEAFDNANSTYKERKANLDKLKAKKSNLPKSGADALLERDKLDREIEDYNNDFVKPARADKNKFKKLWEKSAQDLAVMQGLNVENTKKSTEAQNQEAAAADKTTESTKRKTRAKKESAQATEEEAKKSAELIAKEAELKQAEEALVKAGQDKEKQDAKTAEETRNAEDAAKNATVAEQEHAEALKNLHKEQDQHRKDLEQLNQDNKDTIAINEDAQKMLAETSEKIREQGEKIRDAELIKKQAQTEGIEKTEQAIRVLQEQNRQIDTNSEEWKKNTVTIQQLQAALDEMKGKPALMMMEERMKNVGSLSSAAVTETKHFWEAMVAGAEKGSDRLKTAEGYLKTITEEEQKRNRAALETSAGRLKGNLGNLSESELRQAINDAKQLQTTYKSTSTEAREMAQAIVNAEEFVKRYGVEAERAARKQDEADRKAERAARDKEQAEYEAQQKQRQMMLERAMLEKNRTSLSAQALDETKRYWKAVADGADEGSVAQRNALAVMQKLTEEEQNRNKAANEKKASILDRTLSDYSEAEVRQAIEAGKQLIQTYKVGSDEADAMAKKVVAAEEHIKNTGLEAQRTAQREASSVKLMADQLERLGSSMSESALKAQEQYWQRMIDDPKAAAGAIAGYVEKLNEVHDIQKRQAEAKVKVGGLSVLDRMRSDVDYESKISENQRKEDIAALKAYRDSLPKEGNVSVLKEIDYYLTQLGKTASDAAQQTMSLAQAETMAGNLGKQGYSATTTQLQQAKKALLDAQQVAGRGTPRFRELQEAINKVDLELAKTGEIAQSVQTVLDKPKGQSLNALKMAVDQGRAALQNMDRTTEEGQKAFDELAAKIKAADQEMKALSGTARGTASAFEKAWSRLKTYVVMYVGANAALQRLMGTMGDLMELSDKLGEVRKTTGFTADEVGHLSNELKKLDTRTSITGLLDLSVAAGQLGLKTQEDVQGFTEAANKLMVALPEMGREGATEMLKVALATGEIDKIGRQMRDGLIGGSSATAVAMEKVGSTIDRLRATSAATAPAITDFVKRVGAVGAQSGITIDQVAALGSTVDALGMRVEMSATALSRMVPAIKNNAFAIGQMIGKTEEYIKTQFAEGKGMNVILDVFDTIKKSGKTSADDIEAMFGSSMQEIMKELNQQGARAGIVFAGLSQNVDELRRQLGVASKAYKENVAIQQEYDKMNETTMAKWERFKNQLEEFFVGDNTQRFLGGIIDGLRQLLDFITDDGPIAKGMRYIGTYLGLLKSKWSEAFGSGVLELFDKFKQMGEGVDETGEKIGDFADKLVPAITSVKGFKNAWKGLNTEMKANIITAVATALAYLGSMLWDWHKAAKEAAAEQGRFNQQIADEQKAVSDLITPLKDSNLAQEERKKLMAELNSQYGRYLGYMVDETTTAIQLAEAHALIAKRIREEAYERRLMEKEREVKEKYEEDINVAYTEISNRVRSGVKSGVDAQGIADALKGIIDNNADKITSQLNENGTSTYTANNELQKILSGYLERQAQDGNITRKHLPDINDALGLYINKAGRQHSEIMERTAGVRSDLRSIRGAIQTDLTNNLSRLIRNIAKSGGQQTKPQGGVGPLAPQPYKLPTFGQNGGFGFGMFGQGSQQQSQVNIPLPGDRQKIDEKNTEQVRQYVQDQDNLRSYLKEYSQSISENDRKAAEAWLDSEEEVNRLRKVVAKADSENPDSPTYNPYGSFSAMDSYDKWSADALVDRKKQMLDYVKAMANGADVQAILSQDKKFMDEATKKGIKNVRDAIEWYNTERLKIQQELADRHLTNEGGWANPSKAKGRKTRMPIADSAVAELDRYYAWRKETVEEQRAEEGMSEAEFNRRLETLEMEHLQKRSDLRKSYISKDKEYVKQFRKWWASVRELDEVEWDLIEAEVKVATEKDRKYIGMNAQKDLTSMQAIVVKQLNAIEDIIAKERPFNGITENLEANLTKMGILFADFDRRRNELTAGGASKEEIDKVNAAADAERNKRLMWVLQQAEEGYTLTIDEMMRRMAESGMQAWADELNSNENGDEMKRALLAQLHVSYDAVQDAVKKEASIIKKQVETMWSDVAKGQTMSIKDQYEEALNALGMQQDSVSRANSLIGAGANSELAADKLAIKQLELKIAMQEHYFNLMRKQGADRIAFLKEESRLEKEKAVRMKKQLEQEDDEKKRRELMLKIEKAERNAMQASLDAEHAETSLNLAKTKEKSEMLKLQAELSAKVEESQNRIYTQLKEWGELLASSIQGVFEASAAGNREYYNERAKLDLTGKGGPGAGTYIVINDEGTDDAEAHYEYLDERRALERQHEIEQQNARADAWKKLADDLNMKMSEQITDWMNAQAIDANTQAVMANTEAIYASMGATGVSDFTDASKMKRDENGMALDDSGSIVYPIQPTEQPEETPAWKPWWQMTDEEKAQGISNMSEMYQAYNEIAIAKETEKAAALTEIPGYTPPLTVPLSDEQTEQIIEKQTELNNAVGDLSDKTADKQVANQTRVQQAEKQTETQMVKGSQGAFAKMIAAANLYGAAYQAMSNDNLSTAQKFEMMALQAAGNAAIAALQVDFSEKTTETAMTLPVILAKCLGINPIYGPVLFAVLSALLGGMMGVAASKLSKGKSDIAKVSGASASAGRLSTGMMTYAKGNVDEFTDPDTLTPGRSYNVDAADGKTYRAKYTGRNPRTHITNGPEFHLAGEKGREAIIDAHTTQMIRLNEVGIWKDIQTLSQGGGLSTVRRRKGRGVRAFADGNLDDFEELTDEAGTDAGGGLGSEQVMQLQASLDRNSDVLERAMTEGIKGVFNVYGKGGLVDSYDTGKKTVTSHGERY